MARRRQVRHNKSSCVPAWLWFFSGLACGLLAATVAVQTGFISPPASLQVLDPAVEEGNTDVAESSDEIAPRQRQHDFYSVLPQQDNPIPVDELQRAAQQSTTTGSTTITADQSNARYILQVASLRSASDADGLKAELGLLGISATIVPVTINDTLWHRIRVGPIAEASSADQMRQQLENGGYQVQVFRE